MLTVYLAALAFGLVLIGASVFQGDGGGHDSGHGDVDGHGDGHGDADHGAFLTNLLSLRFWTYALGAFGMAGTALSLLGVSVGVHVPVSVVLGFVVGAGVAALFRSLGRGSATSPASTEAFLGSEGEVVLPLLPDGLGKIRLHVGDQDVEVPARTGGVPIEIRERVVVVRFREGVAEVEPAPWKD
jgi:membrane protein implicated in regulation of membrane protease activity